jgi:hypothetical protein
MQNKATSVVKDGKSGYKLVTDTPYARRVYYNPENTRVSREANSNARIRWLEPYISGDKKKFVFKTFMKFAKKKKR